MSLVRTESRVFGDISFRRAPPLFVLATATHQVLKRVVGGVRVAMNKPGEWDVDNCLGHLRVRARQTVVDKIQTAFHFACDVNDLDIACQLLQALQVRLSMGCAGPIGDTGRLLAGLVAGHERLWALRQFAEPRFAAHVPAQPIVGHLDALSTGTRTTERQR